jgi:hypothetical protein
MWYEIKFGHLGPKARFSMTFKPSKSRSSIMAFLEANARAGWVNPSFRYALNGGIQPLKLGINDAQISRVRMRQRGARGS